MNPEYYTIWNYRRDIIINHYKVEMPAREYAKLFERELGFIMMKLKEFPKVYWIWNHRLWTLENHLKADWRMELGFVNKLLTLDSRNFHGWQYRRIVIDKIERIENTTLDLSEFKYTTEMIVKNFSNFSAWHHRSTLIPKLLQSKPTEEFQDIYEFLKKELDLLRNAMYTDPEDQSVWIYLRWLLTDNFFRNGLSIEQYVQILKNELGNVKELNELELDDNNGIDNNWCLKTIITIEKLISEYSGEDQADQHAAEVKSSLEKLIQVDPLRRNMYIDQLKSL